MTVLSRRKKQPEQVRRNLLDSAARLAAEQGLSALTIQAVADAAGVSKGGLLYHFGHKEALIEAVFADLMDHLDSEIDRLMASDPDPHGRFTRAYINTTFACADDQVSAVQVRMALSVTLIADPHLRQLWTNWLEERLGRHGERNASASLSIARFSADGIWLASVLIPEEAIPKSYTAVQPYLLAMTRDTTHQVRTSPVEGRL